MSTIVSARRGTETARIHSGNKESWGGVAPYVEMLAGIALFVAGIMTNMNPLLILGFFGIAISFFQLNAKFWANFFEKHPDRMPRPDHHLYYE